MTFAELKNIRQDNNKDCSRSRLSRLCYVIYFVPHDLARNKFIFSLPVRNDTIFSQACIEDLIFFIEVVDFVFQQFQ